MGEIITSLIIIVLMLIAVCFIGSPVLAKDTKELHINFSWKGFEISGSFLKTITHKKISSNISLINSILIKYIKRPDLYYKI